MHANSVYVSLSKCFTETDPKMCDNFAIRDILVLAVYDCMCLRNVFEFEE